MNFVACELDLATPHDRERILGVLSQRTDRPMLVLSTCQRLECFGFGLPEIDSVSVVAQHEQAAAFERLARIAAGLESRILGELEVLGQVRTAYKTFRERGGASLSRLDRVFQDALALAREARRESGIDRNLTSLGALASREILDRLPNTTAAAVIGSGSLAGSVARYLTKRGRCTVRVMSRCPENAMTLAMEVGGFAAGLEDIAPQLKGISAIVTATAAPHAIVYPQHLAEAARPLVIVDLGVPPDCSPDIASLHGVTYISLAQIEEKAQINSDERRQCAEVAARIVREGAQAWAAKLERYHETH
jgi:glutamyl-tRNA reductase